MTAFVNIVNTKQLSTLIQFYQSSLYGPTIYNFGITNSVGIITPSITYKANTFYMRAYDASYYNYVFWTTLNPLLLPTTTIPSMSNANNLIDITIIQRL